MATNAVLGLGATLYQTDTSPERAVSEVVTITGPGLEAAEVEVTHLGSTGRERIQGILDGGSFELSFNWTKHASQVALRNAVTNRTTHTFRMTWPTSPETTFTFTGVPLSFAMDETGPENPVRATVSMRVSDGGSWG